MLAFLKDYYLRATESERERDEQACANVYSADRVLPTSRDDAFSLTFLPARALCGQEELFLR